jgi:hypothetical protein
MNKTSIFLTGITGGELTPCEGYVAKLQVRAAKNLVQFREDLKLVLVNRNIVYWDDTVIMILAKRACFRFTETKQSLIIQRTPARIWKVWMVTMC